MKRTQSQKSSTSSDGIRSRSKNVTKKPKRGLLKRTEKLLAARKRREAEKLANRPNEAEDKSKKDQTRKSKTAATSSRVDRKTRSQKLSLKTSSTSRKLKSRSDPSKGKRTRLKQDPTRFEEDSDEDMFLEHLQSILDSDEGSDAPSEISDIENVISFEWLTELEQFVNFVTNEGKSPQKQTHFSFAQEVLDAFDPKSKTLKPPKEDTAVNIEKQFEIIEKAKKINRNFVEMKKEHPPSIVLNDRPSRRKSSQNQTKRKGGTSRMSSRKTTSKSSIKASTSSRTRRKPSERDRIARKSTRRKTSDPDHIRKAKSHSPNSPSTSGKNSPRRRIRSKSIDLRESRQRRRVSDAGPPPPAPTRNEKYAKKALMERPKVGIRRKKGDRPRRKDPAKDVRFKADPSPKTPSRRSFTKDSFTTDATPERKVSKSNQAPNMYDIFDDTPKTMSPSVSDSPTLSAYASTDSERKKWDSLGARIAALEKGKNSLGKSEYQVPKVSPTNRPDTLDLKASASVEKMIDSILNDEIHFTASATPEMKKIPEVSDDKMKEEVMKLKRLEPEVPLSDPNRVNKYMFIGDTIQASHLPTLKRLKITHILNCAMEIEPNETHYDFEYLHLMLRDRSEQYIGEHLMDAFQYILEVMNEKGHVLIHCRQGISRSATILVAFLMWYKRISVDNAIATVASKRKMVAPNSGFMKQLRSFENHIMKTKNKRSYAALNAFVCEQRHEVYMRQFKGTYNNRRRDCS